MGGGGKGGTSTSTVSIPPEVLARYNAVNARAEEVAQTPFQAYGGEFVAPMNEVQQQGVSQTQQYSGAAQPYYQTAAGLTQQAVDATKPLTAAQIQQYQNPYVQSVVDPTLAALRQQQAQDRQAQTAQAIRSGAFGGERAGLQRAVLGGQQELAQAQAISPLYAQAYNQALAAAQQQQGQRVAGLMGAGQQIAGIGTGAQQAGLQGAQAVIGAGTLGQQTKQALDTAQYQQFLQERGYPFQTAQFLANIAEGTGALSGSTTTTTQPTSFFSDKRLKHSIKKIGKTNDGLPIYSFKYNGDDRTQIGLMAQDVEKKHPEAVGLAGGYKTVDYEKATAGARHARAAGGLVPSSMGGAVFEPGAYNRGGYAGGGLISDPNDLQAILAAQRQSFGPFAAGGLYGASAQQDPRGGVSGYVPKAALPVPKLVTASPASRTQQGGLQSAMQNIASAGSTAKTLGEGYDWASGKFKSTATPTGELTGKYPSADVPNPPVRPDELPSLESRGGGIMPRHHYGSGGFLDPYKPPSSGSMVPEDVMESSEETKDEAEKLQPKASGTGGGGGGGGLGSALGAASSLMTVGKGIGSFASWLPTLFLKHGGNVYGHFADGGIVPRQAFGGNDPGGEVQSVSNDETRPKPDFERAVNRTFQFEGGLNPADTNGTPSLYGINQAAHPEFFKNPSKEGAKDIYRNDYWNKIGADQMDPNLAHVAYDTAVIAGPSRALSFVQQAGGDPAKLLQIRKDYQDSLIAQDPAKYGKYEKAWNNRLNTLYGDIGSEAPSSGMGLGKAWQGMKSAADSFAPRTYKGEDQTMGQFLTSRDFIIPLLTGLGTMASSPSRYLGAAILQGLGGGAQAYASLQKQQADIDKTRAATTVGLSNISPENLIGQYNSKGQLEWTVRKPTGVPGQLTTATPGGLGGTGNIQPVTGVSAPQAPTLPPLSVNTEGGRYTWEVKPTQATDDYFARNQLGNDPYAMQSLIAQKGLKGAAETDKKIAEATKAAAGNAPEARMKIGQLTDELNRLASSQSKLTGAGPGQGERAAAANIYNYLAGLSGMPALQLAGADRDITSSQIINKIQQEFGSSQAQNRGFHAGYIAEKLTDAFPTGAMTPEAARKMSAALYVGNQMSADFARYYDNYLQKYGTSLGVQENFRRDMGAQYDQDKKIIESALQKPGLVEYLRSHPEKAAEFDAYWKRPGLARMFVGG